MIDFEATFDKYFYRESRPKTFGRYYPSEIGSCLRKVWYSYKYPKQLDPKLLKVFHMGNMVHDLVAEIFKSPKTPEIELLREEVAFKEYIDDFVISGRIDDVILIKHNNETVLVEVKSTGALSFVKEPSEQHLRQLYLYEHITGIHNGVLLYVEKNTLKSKSFVVPYEKEKAEEVIQRFRDLHSALKTGKAPPAEAKQKEKTLWMCDYCDYKKECDALDAGELNETSGS